jgi:ATP-dependent phosphoenolpyruvate carboxykinase
LDGTEYKVASVNAENPNNNVILVVIGDGQLPPVEKLQQRFEGHHFTEQYYHR